MKSQEEIQEYLELHEITMGMRRDERAELDKEVGDAVFDRPMHKAQEYMKRFGYTQGWIAALKWVLGIPSTPAPFPQEANA